MPAAHFRRSTWAAAAALTLTTLSACTDDPDCRIPKGVKTCLTVEQVKDMDTVRAAGRALLASPGLESEVLLTPPKNLLGGTPSPIPGTGRYRGDAAETAVGGSLHMEFTEDGHTDAARYTGGHMYVRYWKAVDDRTGEPAWVARSQAQLAKKGDEWNAVAERTRAANPLITGRLLADFTPGPLDEFSRSAPGGRELHLSVNAESLSEAGRAMLADAFPDHYPKEFVVDLRLDEQKRITWYEETMDFVNTSANGVKVRVMHTFKPAAAPVTLGPPEGVLNPPQPSPTGS
ncbi:hypothetical protein QEZ40_007515 [Streptomyces katrae]|uniref:Lipoprotein n=1 Tax=Streptomyces katrae TaxID=68223 RepID=A0ABT7H5H9_9ACTN|nr:hypothetical protein [Streptomyces katrae]MDK9501143.1 hypothetical protein [Streptomyces katrae]